MSYISALWPRPDVTRCPFGYFWKFNNTSPDCHSLLRLLTSCASILSHREMEEHYAPVCRGYDKTLERFEEFLRDVNKVLPKM